MNTVEKRVISPEEAENAVEIEVTIPEYSGSSHPFSMGPRPEVYTPGGLKKITTKSSERTDWFLQHFCALSDILAGPVPFFFRTSDGRIRSLDAGCLGYLWNRPKPLLTVNINADGFIGSAGPTRDGIKQVGHFVTDLKRKFDPQ